MIWSVEQQQKKRSKCAIKEMFDFSIFINSVLTETSNYESKMKNHQNPWPEQSFRLLFFLSNSQNKTQMNGKKNTYKYIIYLRNWKLIEISELKKRAKYLSRRVHTRDQKSHLTVWIGYVFAFNYPWKHSVTFTH